MRGISDRRKRRVKRSKGLGLRVIGAAQVLLRMSRLGQGLTFEDLFELVFVEDRDV